MIENFTKNVLLATGLGVTMAAPVFADGMDFFFHSTPGNTPPQGPTITPLPGLPSGGSKKTPTKSQAPTIIPKPISANAPVKKQVLVWFENFDDIIYTAGPSDHEKYILKRPINQEAERLREWIDADNSMAKSYRLVARRIRALTPCNSVSDLREFEMESADWYDDVARLCEEMTAPHPPAKTYEELERAYKGFIMRSKNLVEEASAITELNKKLRNQYDVHQPKYIDQSAKFIDSVGRQFKGK